MSLPPQATAEWPLAGGIHVWVMAFAIIVMVLTMAWDGYGPTAIFVTWLLMQIGYFCWLVLRRDDGND
jgi:hypothetical protein